jgi:cyanophycin synthetase
LRATEPDADGASFAFYECKSHDAGIAIAKAVSLLFKHAIGQQPDGSIDEVASLLDRISLHARLLKHVMAAGAAERLGIPWSVVASTGHPTVALGHGKHRRLFWRHLTPATSEVGDMLAQSKPLTAEVLRKAGLPVPSHRVVTELNAALDAARAIGWPVVIKPTHGGRGTAVTTHITDEETLASGFEEARKHGSVLVEKHIEGESYRVLVFHGRCIAVSRNTAARVVGDGTHSVAALVERANSMRSERLGATWKKIEIDKAALTALRQQGVGVSDVPASGRPIYLRLHSNLSAGGTAERVTSTFHPDNKRLAITAAALLEIDLAGVDMIISDGTRSYHEVGGTIVEVNTNPGLKLGEPVGVIDDLIVGEFFPTPDRGRIPIVAILQQNGGTGPNHLPELLGNEQAPCAVARLEDIRVGSDVIATGALNLPQRTGRILSDPAAALAVIFLTPNEFARQGIGSDQIALAVAAPPWADTVDPSFFGLAALANTVIIPKHWLSDYQARQSCDAGLWVINTNAEEPSGAPNEVAWRASDNTILLRSLGTAELMLAKTEPRQGLRDALTLAAIGAAMAIPRARIAEIFIRYG